ncbi:isochorismatase family cysteine hydrolase [Streptomyces sp. SR27]|uniref:cysteine hydrolase family protein n=1 Tax=Streptomyces sp. SR27 TaxID=3076630 RepID=UPI00295A90BE|nr:isochorismatase family cysteine hydrolase [Streptomyces sp. SR27]MDV9188441.1 isochorismatase family cysteine hydrolase [Streptomyces sp. SR27]
MTGENPEGTALVVVDLQNDFCTGATAMARYGKDPAALDTAVAGCVRAVARARERGVEVVFVRFVGDPEHQGAGWRLRDRTLGKRPKCLEGSWGVGFHAATPAPDERVFTKRACFDAFLADGFEEYLVARGVGHLALAGLYADVCVDSTARTAFQKGFHVTLLTDCSTSLHLPYDDVRRFMRTVYGARTTTTDDPRAWTTPMSPTEEAPCARPPR